MSQGIRHAPFLTFANERAYARLLILSAVDSYNLIYSLACVNMSKISCPAKAMPRHTGHSGEYRGRTDDLLHAMQAL